MEKVLIKMTVKDPVHTGADSKLGNINTFNRTPISLGKSRKIKTKVKDKDSLIALFSQIAYINYKCMSDAYKDKYGGYEFFFNRWRYVSAQSNDMEEFISSLISILDISYRGNARKLVKKLIGKTSIDELRYINESYIDWIQMELREQVQDLDKQVFAEYEDSKKILGEGAVYDFDYETVNGQSRFKIEYADDGFEIDIHEIKIPCIRANSINGTMRALQFMDWVENALPKDYWNSILENPDKKHLKENVYNWFSSGGNITSATAILDIPFVHSIMKANPYMSIMGLAYGSGTLESCINFDWAYPECKELGTSEKSYLDLISLIQGIRRDSKKSNYDVNIDILGEKTQQMIYNTECLKTGTVLNSSIRFNLVGGYENCDPIALAFFARSLQLLKESEKIGGKIKVLGTVSFEFDEKTNQLIRDHAHKAVDYMQSNQAETIKIIDSWK